MSPPWSVISGYHEEESEMSHAHPCHKPFTGFIIKSFYDPLLLFLNSISFLFFIPFIHPTSDVFSPFFLLFFIPLHILFTFSLFFTFFTFFFLFLLYFPSALEPLLRAWTKPGDLVLDVFAGNHLKVSFLSML